MQRFIISYLIFTLLISLPPLALYHNGYGYLLIHKFNVVFFFFSVITFMVGLSVIIGNKNSSTLGTQVFLIGTTAKIICIMAFALMYLRQNHVNTVYFMACFFYLYFLNTAFEVYGLLTNLRNPKIK